MNQVSDKDAESWTKVEGMTKRDQGQMINMKVEGGKAPDKFTDRHRQPA